MRKLIVVTPSAPSVSVPVQLTYKFDAAKRYTEYEWSYKNAISQAGTVVKESYNGINSTNSLNVYLPYGYDESKKYNVFYFMHGISKSHFHRIYKELFDTSCKEDIITSRIEKAKWLLENTIVPVTQIAEQCGYLNISHFIRQFGNRVEMKPSDYRKKFSKEQ